MASIYTKSRYRSLFLGMGLYLVAMVALRGVLDWKFAHVSPVSLVGVQAFFVGMRMDLAAVFILFVPWAVWLTFLPERFFVSRIHGWLLSGMLFVASAAQLFLLKTEYEFFDEFNARFNTVAVDYLLYPREVFVNIWQSYPVVLVLGCSLGGALVIWLLFRNWIRPAPAHPLSFQRRIGFLAVYLVLAMLFTRSVSYSTTRFGNDRVLDEVSSNGAYSFVYAAFTRHLDYPAFYKTISSEEAYTRARKLVSQPGAKFIDDPHSIERFIPSSRPGKPLNLVVILVESFGSEFWGCLGNANPTLTPEMDALTHQGLLFTNLYASGNRTVRGMEGVLSSFPPLPGDSIVKRNLSDNVATLARAFKAAHYDTLFLYGGRGVFDGMRSYAVRNGYDRFIEQKDFKNPSFTTIWGVADEDLHQRSVEEFRTLHAQGKPFFATVLTVSNHKPYTYPAGRIAENPNDHSRHNAVKYTDWALGDFFRRAQKEEFFKDTVFVVVADHGARVYGSQTIPIRSYQIPCVMVGPTVRPGSTCDTLGSSLDIGPTAMGFTGLGYQSVFFGRDLLRIPKESGWAVMNHNRDVSLYRGGELVILGINKTTEYFQMDLQKKDIVRLSKLSPSTAENEKDAIALFQVADDLYMNQRYHVKEN